MPSKSRSDGKILIYLMIGRCISEWANIEETLFDIFCLILSIETELAAIIFYKTPTLDSRRTLMTELIEARFPTSPGKPPHRLLKEWRGISGEVETLVPYRNLMAHHPIDQVLDEKPITYFKSKFFTGWAKKTHKVETNKSEQLRKRAPRTLYDLEMSNYFDEVRSLHLRIQNYRLSMQKLLLSPHEQLTSQPPTVRGP
jgi:hypothetical protein